MGSALRVMYIFTSYSEKGAAVQTKVMNQIKYLNLAGLRTRGAFFTTLVSEKKELGSDIDLLPVRNSNRKFFRNREVRLNLEGAIFDHLAQNHNAYDAVYFRYPLATKGLWEIVNRFGAKIIFEHQAKEIPEILSLVKNEPVRPKLGYLLYLSEFGVSRVWREWYYGKRIFRKLRYGVAVTKEVAEYENQREGNYRCEVVGNGIDLERYSLVRDSSFNGKDLRLFMLIGANTSSPTHGVDRLIRSVRNNRSKLHIHVSIFSKNTYASEKGANYEISYEGFLTQDQLDQKLEGMHFAVGGLTSFRKNVLYGSALKVREYFSRGFPIIMASIDEDIERDAEARKYVIQVPNKEQDIDFESIAEQIRTILDMPERPYRIRQIAARLFSFPAKMEDLGKKIESIINSRNDRK